MKRPWDDLYTAEELEARRLGGYGQLGGIGERPAVVVVDVVRGFTGDRGDDHVTALRKYRSACGPGSWDAVEALARLVDAGRSRRFPVVFTRAQPLPVELRGAQRRKNARAGREAEESGGRGSEWIPELTPRPGDVVIEKTKPSIFFGTPLLSHLQSLGVDHLIVGGTTTSGCVRASVYDAFSYNFGVTVVEDACFDRFPTSHKANLFDMDSKFADVRPLADVLRDLEARFPHAREAAGALGR
ncbi:MAG TPA: isochorismatase family protein [Candidatus Limnocylindria bacterium]|nr:isochorismatase family protein [Candidatus Limnocylindria bacterium]